MTNPEIYIDMDGVLTDSYTESGVLERTKLKKPVPWTVVIHNDDYTPMDFVVVVLMQIFHLDVFAANEITLRIHLEGRANVGSFSREIAETKANLVVVAAHENGHPLLAEPQQA